LGTCAVRVLDSPICQGMLLEGSRRCSIAGGGSQTAAPPLPLAGVRVLDLSLLLPGPYCSRILADFGAEVIRVARPGGADWLRHAPPLVDGVGALFRALNRGKKSITLNLKADEGRAIFFQLIETADVLLEGFRPGVMARLGVGYERLSGVNPRLVYCSLSGYGQEGPYRNRAGHDLNYIGLAGLLDLTGPRWGPPVIPGVPVADLNGALWAALGIVLALLAREQTGHCHAQGQRVNGSLFGGALACLPMAVVHTLGGQPVERGKSTLTGGLVCYNVYETRDGKYVTLAALEPQFWAAFCQAVERGDLIGQQFAPTIPGEPAYDDLCTLFRTRTRQEWAEAMADVDACLEPVYDVEEALASPPVQALGMLQGLGLLPPVRLSAQSARPAEHVPTLGEHTAALLAELGYDAAALDELREQGVV
jgi:alpha-methylacyl-CoA racemase